MWSDKNPEGRGTIKGVPVAASYVLHDSYMAILIAD